MSSTAAPGPDPVVIGMDPHKRSATIEVMDPDEAVLGGGRFGTDRDGYDAMLRYGRQWPEAAEAEHVHPLARRVRLGAFEGPVFADARGGWRDRSNVGKAFRQVRGGSDFEWVKTHTYRKTVATLLDQSGASARMIADQLGHSRVSMTQDVYLGRKAGNAGNLKALEAYNPDLPTAGDDTGGGK